LGIRLHRDQVQRNHSEIQARMLGGELNYIEGSNILTNRNEDTSNALAIFAEDEIIVGNLSAKIGARAEHVRTKRDTRNPGDSLQENSDTIFVPGVGLNYSVTDSFVLLAGINKGFTLVGPGQDDSIEPEEALNYEAGFRLKGAFSLEAVAFYSDYKNLKGTCSFSTGCNDDDIDTEFNGGEAEIYGLESMASHTLNAGNFSFPLRLGYTFTVARFKTEFINSNPEWGPTGGIIRQNDPLSYVPQNQVTLGSGVHYKKFAMDVNLLWKGQMADQAVAESRSVIPSYGVIDTAFSYRYSKKGKAFLRVNNLLDNTYLVSLRPFGARPGAPRTIVAGVNQRF
jgi:Fe(3+) dicitrate transport protein